MVVFADTTAGVRRSRGRGGTGSGVVVPTRGVVTTLLMLTSRKEAPW